MSESEIKIITFVGAFFLVTLISAVHIFFVQKKSLKLLAGKACPDCSKYFGDCVKMEQRFSDVENRVQWKFPIKINITSIWPVRCPHCGSAHVFNITKNEFKPW